MQLFGARIERLLAAGWIMLLLLPSLAWVLIDKRVWAWDPSYYGLYTMRLAQNRQDLGTWLDECLHALKIMPPLLVWLGQFFVPLRYVTGNIETALTLVNVAAAAGTLFCVYRTARILAAGLGSRRELLIALTAVSLCGGAPLFVSLIHHYLTEPLQTFAAALSLLVALQAEQRPLLRNAAYVIWLVAISLLAKATSFLFVLPALTYIAIALYATRKAPRPPATAIDAVSLGSSLVAFGFTMAWYALNWGHMAHHFVEASIGGEVQKYSGRENALIQLEYWIRELGDAIFLKRTGAIALLLVVLAALIMRALKLRGSAEILKSAVKNHTLFALYIAGTITAVVMAYSLQINKDPRYSVMLVPLVAVLIAWSLTVVRYLIVAVALFLMATVNAAVVNASSLGMGTVLYPWLWQLDLDASKGIALTEAISTSCNDNSSAHPVAIGVSYYWINANTTNFYAWKKRLQTGVGCVYYQIPQTSVDDVWKWMDTYNVASILTIAPEQQIDPPDFVNGNSKVVAEALAVNPRFEAMPIPDAQFRMYKYIK